MDYFETYNQVATVVLVACCYMLFPTQVLFIICFVALFGIIGILQQRNEILKNSYIVSESNYNDYITDFNNTTKDQHLLQ